MEPAANVAIVAKPTRGREVSLSSDVAADVADLATAGNAASESAARDTGGLINSVKTALHPKPQKRGDSPPPLVTFSVSARVTRPSDDADPHILFTGAGEPPLPFRPRYQLYNAARAIGARSPRVCAQAAPSAEYETR